MDEMREEAVRIAQRLQAAGHVAYFAGGCVRDQLLGKQPKDYDIATNATPKEVLKLFPGANKVGAHFGVILVRSRGFHFEIATFRTDGSYRDGRRPESVTFSSPEEDAQRRDFTVNGIFFDPVSAQIIDHVGGQEDLRAGVLRAIGDADARFAEDHLRLMRAVRFATVLGYRIEESTWNALCRHAPAIAEISIERVREEFVRLMLHPNRLAGFDLLDRSGLLELVIPEMSALKGCTQPPEFHPEGDVFVHTRLMLSLLPEEVPVPLLLSVLLHDIAKPATRTVDPDGRIRFNGHDKLGAEMAEQILKRMRFSNDVVDDTKEMVLHHMRFMHVQDMRGATLRRFMARSTFPMELALHRVDCLGSNGELKNWEFLQTQLAEFTTKPVLPPRIVNGGDLLALGYPAGPLIGEILTAVQDRQLEGTLTDQEEALAWVRTQWALS